MKFYCVTYETKKNLETLRDTTLSQDTHSAAHLALENDADLQELVSNLFSHVDMAEYWKDFLFMTDALMMKSDLLSILHNEQQLFAHSRNVNNGDQICTAHNLTL